jgi:hypothetical protein
MLSHGDVRPANPAESKITGGNTGNTGNSPACRRAMRGLFRTVEKRLPHYRKYRKFPPSCRQCLHAGGSLNVVARLPARQGWG